MTEQKQFRNALITLGLVVFFSFLYSLGGFGHIWVRRYLAPLCLSLGLFALTKNWRTLVYGLLLCGALHLGYGADLFWAKIFRRLIFGLGVSLPSLVLNKKIAIVNIVLTTGMIIYLGVWNPLPNARVEELVIGLVIVLLPSFMVKREV